MVITELIPIGVVWIISHRYLNVGTEVLPYAHASNSVVYHVVKLSSSRSILYIALWY